MLLQRLCLHSSVQGRLCFPRSTKWEHSPSRVSSRLTADAPVWCCVEGRWWKCSVESCPRPGSCPTADVRAASRSSSPVMPPTVCRSGAHFNPQCNDFHLHCLKLYFSEMAELFGEWGQKPRSRKAHAKWKKDCVSAEALFFRMRVRTEAPRRRSVRLATPTRCSIWTTENWTQPGSRASTNQRSASSLTWWTSTKWRMCRFYFTVPTPTP